MPLDIDSAFAYMIKGINQYLERGSHEEITIQREIAGVTYYATLALTVRLDGDYLLSPSVELGMSFSGYTLNALLDGSTDSPLGILFGEHAESEITTLTARLEQFSRAYVNGHSDYPTHVSLGENSHRESLMVKVSRNGHNLTVRVYSKGGSIEQGSSLYNMLGRMKRYAQATRPLQE